MKKIIFIFILFSRLSIAQINLVPNASFEIIDTCNFSNAGISDGHAPPWDIANRGSPDLFNICDLNSICQTPSNFSGFQYPHTGNGYVGEAFYAPSVSNFREYIQVKLDSDLVANKKYCASFYVSLANNFNVATNNFGMYFSATHIYDTVFSQCLNLIPQINNTTVITDTLGWTLVTGHYTAVGGERYIIIGNFFTDANTNIQWVANQTGGDAGYYLIDDVSVMDCTNEGVGEINESSLRIFPNPATSTLIITTENATIESMKLYNILGSEMLNRVQHDGSVTVDVSGLSNGIYFVEVLTEKGIVRKKVVKE